MIAQKYLFRLPCDITWSFILLLNAALWSGVSGAEVIPAQDAKSDQTPSADTVVPESPATTPVTSSPAMPPPPTEQAAATSVQDSASTAIAAPAADESGVTITTLSGKTFTNCTIGTYRSNGLEIIHDSGTAFLRFAELPPEIRAQYELDSSTKKRLRQEELAATERKRQNAILKDLEKRKLGLRNIRILQVLPGEGFLAIDENHDDRTIFIATTDTLGYFDGMRPVNDTFSYQSGSEIWSEKVFAVWPIGTYSYVNTLGAPSTVLKYTTDTNSAKLYFYGTDGL